jgi:hypothetical protein
MTCGLSRSLAVGSLCRSGPIQARIAQIPKLTVRTRVHHQLRRRMDQGKWAPWRSRQRGRSGRRTPVPVPLLRLHHVDRAQRLRGLSRLFLGGRRPGRPRRRRGSRWSKPGAQPDGGPGQLPGHGCLRRALHVLRASPAVDRASKIVEPLERPGHWPGATLGATGTNSLVAARTRVDNAKRLPPRCHGPT